VEERERTEHAGGERRADGEVRGRDGEHVAEEELLDPLRRGRREREEDAEADRLVTTTATDVSRPSSGIRPTTAIAAARDTPAAAEEERSGERGDDEAGTARARATPHRREARRDDPAAERAGREPDERELEEGAAEGSPASTGRRGHATSVVRVVVSRETPAAPSPGSETIAPP
jgi:hypothetical protein